MLLEKYPQIQAVYAANDTVLHISCNTGLNNDRFAVNVHI